MKLLAKAPLNLLRAFEAAGRTGAFALAASELELSPSAISMPSANWKTCLMYAFFSAVREKLR